MTIEDRAWKWYRSKFPNPDDNIDRLSLWVFEESGELAKALRQGADEEVLSELGDLALMVTLLCGVYGSSIEKCLEKAVARKEKRVGLK